MRFRLARYWHAFANAVGDFFEEAAFRLVLAFDVLVGRMPRQVERRWWNRSLESPILIDCFDWTNERHIFSALVWPVLESSPERATISQEERVELVREVLHRGAAEMALTTRYETDYGLRWDPDREVWVATDDFAYAAPEWRERGGAA
jgi:hypothetical protein